MNCAVPPQWMSKQVHAADYLEELEWGAGCSVTHPMKNGAIQAYLPPIHTNA